MLVILCYDKVTACVFVAHAADLAVPEVAHKLAPRQNDPAVRLRLFERGEVVGFLGYVVVRYHNGEFRLGRKEFGKLAELRICIGYMRAALLEYHKVLIVK